MKVIHRIGLNASPRQRQILQELGVRLPKSASRDDASHVLIAVDVEETHPQWRAIEQLIREWTASDVVRAVFSDAEVRSARWVELSAWHHGYPQPRSDSFGYLEATYDLGDWCDRCGIAAKQKAPFQMSGEPRWGKHGLMQLIWVYGEIFTTPQIWESTFKPFGVNRRQVVDTNLKELKSVVQLVIEGRGDVDTNGLREIVCEKCGRRKYEPVTGRAFPAIRPLDSTPILRTTVHFGSGRLAFNAIAVAHALVEALLGNRIVGGNFVPTTNA